MKIKNRERKRKQEKKIVVSQKWKPTENEQERYSSMGRENHT